VINWASRNINVLQSTLPSATSTQVFQKQSYLVPDFLISLVHTIPLYYFNHDLFLAVHSQFPVLEVLSSNNRLDFFEYFFTIWLDFLKLSRLLVKGSDFFRKFSGNQRV